MFFNSELDWLQAYLYVYESLFSLLGLTVFLSASNSQPKTFGEKTFPSSQVSTILGGWVWRCYLTTDSGLRGRVSATPAWTVPRRAGHSSASSTGSTPPLCWRAMCSPAPPRRKKEENSQHLDLLTQSLILSVSLRRERRTLKCCKVTKSTYTNIGRNELKLCRSDTKNVKPKKAAVVWSSQTKRHVAQCLTLL